MKPRYTTEDGAYHLCAGLLADLNERGNHQFPAAVQRITQCGPSALADALALNIHIPNYGETTAMKFALALGRLGEIPVNDIKGSNQKLTSDVINAARSNANFYRLLRTIFPDECKDLENVQNEIENRRNNLWAWLKQTASRRPAANEQQISHPHRT
jgi:hypothetical protein